MGVYLNLLLVVFLWGSANVAVKAALPDFPPAALVFWRHLVAALFLLGVLSFTGQFTLLEKREWPGILILGLFGVSLYQLCQTAGLVLTTAANSGWLGLMAPVFIVLFSTIFLKERLTWSKAAGIALAFAGALGLTLGGSSGFHRAAGAPLGDALILLAAVCWAVFTVLARRLATNRAPLVVTTYTFLVGVSLLVPTGPWIGGLRLSGLTVTGCLMMAYLALGCSAVAYLLWYRILGRMEASRAGTWLYLTPLVTSLLAVLIGEQLTAAGLGFGLVTLAGVWLVSRSR